MAKGMRVLSLSAVSVYLSRSYMVMLFSFHSKDDGHSSQGLSAHQRPRNNNEEYNNLWSSSSPCKVHTLHESITSDYSGQFQGLTPLDNG